jgi:hypothetical protein
LVTERSAHGLSGHLGEWFTVAAGAYCGLKQYRDAPAARAAQQQLFDEIGDEVRHHSEVFGALWRAGDGLGCLKASASIAHNFGDLDRVMDMWGLGVEDPLRLEYHGLGTKPFDPNGKLRHLGRLWTAGELYKSVIDDSSMALENHRHFALRKPRPLRKLRALLVPTGPFFDEWGARIAALLPEAEALEVAQALEAGWVRQPKTQAYGRAFRAISEALPGKLSFAELSKDPARRRVLETPRERFEKKWRDEALKHLVDIPSRA